ncbi:MAG: TetR/AcrR family transcriptional regulator [Shewanella sp.]
MYDRIIAAGWALIKRDGLMGFRFSEIPKLANCSNKSLYAHFKNKEDLILSIYINSMLCKLHQLEQIFLSNQLNNKSKLLISGMLDIVISSKIDEDVGHLQNFVNNHLFLKNISAPTMGEYTSTTYKQKAIFDKYWNDVIRQKEINSNMTEITSVCYRLITLQKGSIQFLFSKNLIDVGWKPDLKICYDSIAYEINKLSWKDEAMVNFEDTISVITDLANFSINPYEKCFHVNEFEREIVTLTETT